MTYQAGQKLGNYRLIRPLGRGGFAEVYLAQHAYLKTQAAIKVLQQRLSDEALEKFLHEARLIANLEHPHIVRVLEFGIEEQRPFLVMSYAPYGTLRRYLRNTVAAPSPAAISPYVHQLAAALQYAHERKIVHRDVKPENILLDTGNSVLLSDFGLAVEARSSYHASFTDSAGTTAYMSPEQLRGRPCPASDQYALGVVIYEWLCKALPFDGPDMSIVVQHFHESPPPLRQHVPSLSPAVEAVVLRALEKDPLKRFGSVVEMARAFEETSQDTKGAATASILSFAQASENGLQSGMVAPSAPLTLSEDASFIALSAPPMPTSGELELSSDRFSSLNAQSVENAPSFSASLILSDSPSTITTEPEVNAPVVPGPRKSGISRRGVIFMGLVGLGLGLGGVGLWELSNGKLSTVASSSQSHPTAQGTTTTRPEATPQTKVTPPSGSNTSNGSAPAPTDQPNASSGSSPTGTPSGTSPVTNPTSAPGAGTGPGSTPGTTPTATPSIAISAQNTVVNGTPLSVSVTTNVGSVAFNLIAVYSGLKNPKKNIPPDRVSGSTDSSGSGAVNWTPSLPRAQVVAGTQASLQVTATSKNGTISSQVLTVSITR